MILYTVFKYWVLQRAKRRFLIKESFVEILSRLKAFDMKTKLLLKFLIILFGP
jgi:hypothetical protein